MQTIPLINSPSSLKKKGTRKSDQVCLSVFLATAAEESQVVAAVTRSIDQLEIKVTKWGNDWNLRSLQEDEGRAQTSPKTAWTELGPGLSLRGTPGWEKGSCPGDVQGYQSLLVHSDPDK